MTGRARRLKWGAATGLAVGGKASDSPDGLAIAHCVAQSAHPPDYPLIAPPLPTPNPHACATYSQSVCGLYQAILELWRRAAWSQLMHGSRMHLYYNMSSLLYKGAFLERSIGPGWLCDPPPLPMPFATSCMRCN